MNPRKICCFLLLALILLVLAPQAGAQQPYAFSSGLVAFFPAHYGREAIYTDVLAFRLHNGELQTPVAGDTAGLNEKGQPIVWMKVEADSTGRLRLPRTRSGGAPAGPGVRAGAMRGGLGAGGGYTYLWYESPKAQTAQLDIKGNSAVYVNGVLHAGDPYSMGFLHLPVPLKKGRNEFYVRGAAVTASLSFPATPVRISTDDPTLPFVIAGEGGEQQGAVVVINSSNKTVRGLSLLAMLEGQSITSPLPDIPAMSNRKVAFRFDGKNIGSKGKFPCTLQLLGGKKTLHRDTVWIESALSGESYNSSFVSDIDGSLQYYSVHPASGGPKAGQALFFSVHGAGVEAINQARAYKAKDWGTLVAPTNRRPRGFNWEDWGRLDALEVLNIVRNRFQPDPARNYLTGHSMGGHGTWFLGATYPGEWAAIAPCAGYPTLKGYGSADGLVPDSSGDPLEKILLRAGNQSDVIQLAENYKPLGVYIFHGDADRTVSVNYARQMRLLLGGFHTDMSYYEYPGGSHWFSDESVDWKPLFDFFRWHKQLPDTAVHTIDFTTANPGISARYRWASILQQQEPLQYSRIQLQNNVAAGTISGSTANTLLLQLDLAQFGSSRVVNIRLDSTEAISYTTQSAADSVVLRRSATGWAISSYPAAAEKNPARYGTFKDAFRNRMVMVYGTAGTAAETVANREKAIYDAESWYYRGNGAMDIITDKEYDTVAYRNRGVILVGNRQNNAAWSQLLSDCPIQVNRGSISVGGKTFSGDDLGAYFVWPLAHSATASVAVIAGSGLKGMQAAFANQYFAGASGFPDYMVFGMDMMVKGAAGVRAAGFFDNEWKQAPANTAGR